MIVNGALPEQSAEGEMPFAVWTASRSEQTLLATIASGAPAIGCRSLAQAGAAANSSAATTAMGVPPQVEMPLLPIERKYPRCDGWCSMLSMPLRAVFLTSDVLLGLPLPASAAPNTQT